MTDKDLTRIFLELYAERVAIMEIDGNDENAEENAYADTVRALSLKCLKILNSSLEWNYEKLPNNTSDLQLSKCNEEIEEVIEAEDYQHQIEELADVLISIGGMARFDEETAKDMFDNFILCLDKFIFMDMVDYAEQKIKILYDRDYTDGYHHKETLH